MKPHEANIIECIEGKDIFFAKKNCVKGDDDFLRYRKKILSDFEKNYLYFYQLTKNHFHGFNSNNVLHQRANDLGDSYSSRVKNLIIRSLRLIKKIMMRYNW